MAFANVASTAGFVLTLDKSQLDAARSPAGDGNEI
jgi:hypothetical protein